jgi:serine/threonine protein kinase
LEYIHSKAYIHGDIKPSNFLIGAGPSALPSSMIYFVFTIYPPRLITFAFFFLLVLSRFALLRMPLHIPRRA